MSYRWAATPGLPTEEADALGLDQRFADQAEAERWLTQVFDELAFAGVHEVTLYEEDRLVYGPMSLEA